MRIVFMGTPDFSVPVLDALVAAGHEIVAVYSQPPRPAGRGKRERCSPVHEAAKAHKLQVLTPKNFKDVADVDGFVAHEADLAVVVAYGLLLPKSILEAPARGCWNIHASLLPRWRGAAPLHRAIMAGDAHTGICIMQMEEGLDTGPVLMRAETAIGPTETTGSLHDRLSQMGAQALIEAIASADDLVAQPQAVEGVTYARKVEKSEARIDWNKSGKEVDQTIRGLSPFPGAWFELNGQRIKVLASEFVSGSGEPGTVLDDKLTVACSTGSVRLTRLQRAGKGPADAVDFLRGFSILPQSDLR